MYVFIIHTYVCIYNMHVTVEVWCPAKSRHFLKPGRDPTQMYQYIDIYECTLHICIYMCVCIPRIHVYIRMYIQYNTHVTVEVWCPAKSRQIFKPVTSLTYTNI